MWLFLGIAVLAFLAMMVRAVQHENEAMVHVVEAAQVAESDGEVLEPSRRRGAATA